MGVGVAGVRAHRRHRKRGDVGEVERAGDAHKRGPRRDAGLLQEAFEGAQRAQRGGGGDGGVATFPQGLLQDAARIQRRRGEFEVLARLEGEPRCPARGLRVAGGVVPEQFSAAGGAAGEVCHHRQPSLGERGVVPREIARQHLLQGLPQAFQHIAAGSEGVAKRPGQLGQLARHLAEREAVGARGFLPRAARTHGLCLRAAPAWVAFAAFERQLAD